MSKMGLNNRNYFLHIILFIFSTLPRYLSTQMEGLKIFTTFSYDMIAKRKAVLYLLSFLILGLAFYFIQPLRLSLTLPCPVHLFTGLHCPGCGSQRAIQSTVNGNIVQAFAWHPLILPTLAILFINWFAVIFKVSWPFSSQLAPYSGKLIMLLFFIFLGFFIFRNIPVTPFNLLAPHVLT